MSLLKSLWGGGAQDSEEKKSSEDVERGEPLESVEESVNPWVKGFGDMVSSVSGYASNLKETVSTTVQQTSFLNEFDEEQKKFERERRRQKDTAVPPWVGFNEEEQMKAQILRLSADSRNVLRNPPPGIQFHFDFAKSYPVALALLKEDSRLQKLRFELVPKKLKEERFWHNYFYRVFLIRQSSQLATLASAEGSVTTSPPPPVSQETQQEVPPASATMGESFTDVGHQDTQDTSTEDFAREEDFASDALVIGQGEENQPISRESMRAELDQLGVDSKPGRGEQWELEEELAKELEEFCMVGDGADGGGGGGGGEGDMVALDAAGEEEWENEIKLMLESHPTNDS